MNGFFIAQSLVLFSTKSPLFLCGYAWLFLWYFLQFSLFIRRLFRQMIGSDMGIMVRDTSLSTTGYWLKNRQSIAIFGHHIQKLIYCHVHVMQRHLITTIAQKLF